MTPIRSVHGKHVFGYELFNVGNGVVVNPTYDSRGS